MGNSGCQVASRRGLRTYVRRSFPETAMCKKGCLFSLVCNLLYNPGLGWLLGSVQHSHMAPQEEPIIPLPSKRWTQFYAALQLAIQRAAHKWTFVFALSLNPAIFTKHFFGRLVLKTFPSVSLSGVRNSPTVQRVSSTPSQALSKPTSSYVSLPFPCPALLSSIHTHPN